MAIGCVGIPLVRTKPLVSVHTVLQNSPVAFGTSGLRGRVEDLTPEVCRAVTAGFLDLLLQEGAIHAGATIHVGHDLRPSSPGIAAEVMFAIPAVGCVANFCGAVPTPALALHALAAREPAIMITGSHIPFDRNGIKFYRPEGELTKADEAPILGCAVKVPDGLADPHVPEADPACLSRYLERYVPVFRGVFSGMRIGLYEHSSVARDMLGQLIEALGGTCIRLGRSDEFVPVDTEAVSESDRVQASDWVKTRTLDLLISTDGDGDRPLVFDGQGDFVPGDVLGICAARKIAASTVVTPVSSNTGLEKSGWFACVHRTKIGSPHVIAAMANATHEPVVGFEANGGFLTGSSARLNDVELAPLPTRDAVLPILAAVSLARSQRIALHELRAGLPQRFTSSDRLQGMATARSKAWLDALAGDASQRTALLKGIGDLSQVDQTDGLRMTTSGDDIVHLRPSGNAPEFRIYVETGDADRSGRLLAMMMERVRIALEDAG